MPYMQDSQILYFLSSPRSTHEGSVTCIQCCTVRVFFRFFYALQFMEFIQRLKIRMKVVVTFRTCSWVADRLSSIPINGQRRTNSAAEWRQSTCHPCVEVHRNVKKRTTKLISFCPSCRVISSASQWHSK